MPTCSALACSTTVYTTRQVQFLAADSSCSSIGDSTDSSTDNSRDGVSPNCGGVRAAPSTQCLVQGYVWCCKFWGAFLGLFWGAASHCVLLLLTAWLCLLCWLCVGSAARGCATWWRAAYRRTRSTALLLGSCWRTSSSRLAAAAATLHMAAGLAPMTGGSAQVVPLMQHMHSCLFGCS